MRLAYGRAGDGERSALFIHGWLCDRSYFTPQFTHFSRARTVATMDLRGHGASDKPAVAPGTYDVETFADDALAVVDDAGLIRPVLIGHSLGALVALGCAVRSPAVSAVVMIDPAPITNEAVKQYFRDSAGACAVDNDRSWRTRFVDGLFMDTDVVRRAEITAAMPAGAPEIAAAVMLAMADFDSAGALASVVVPVLSIGSASPTNAPADLAALCPTITIGQTVGAGHFNHLEVPDQVNPMIERFLAVNDL